MKTGKEPAPACLYLHEPSGGRLRREDGPGLLRAALADYGGRGGTGLPAREAANVRAETGAFGKPRFAGLPQVGFSVSHSGRFWACLMAGREIGLDIEDLSVRRHGDGKKYIALARRFFSADERAYIEAGEDAGAVRALFFRVWTQKEAYVKYTGRGMGAGLDSFSVVSGVAGVRWGRISLAEDLENAYCCGGAIPPPEVVRI
ncbi:MAG: 4'-phosphopantetheinyl transferase superfamily protein [Clostridiales Family XIII bacterium]|nr:4'-phosphopantetheinyl transferase superfamily protein [Clostridiales Family XIII bacterium]